MSSRKRMSLGPVQTYAQGTGGDLLSLSATGLRQTRYAIDYGWSELVDNVYTIYARSDQNKGKPIRQTPVITKINR